jgi:hypothetical protein
MWRKTIIFVYSFRQKFKFVLNDDENAGANGNNNSELYLLEYSAVQRLTFRLNSLSIYVLTQQPKWSLLKNRNEQRERKKKTRTK